MRSAIVATATLLLTACTEEPAPPPAAAPPEPATGVIVDAFEAQTQPLRDAEQLEEEMLKAAEERAKKLEDAGG